ncbi:MAG TPA: hypothetical protein VGM57_17270 [Pseudolabrys sp.]
MAGADTLERLRQFLRELTPKARALLIGELERCVLRGEDIAGVDLVLQELRRVARDQREGAPRVSSAARLFFRPLEPFMVDDRGDHNHPHRIARSSLDALWTWIKRDLLPLDVKTLTDQVGDALLVNDQAKAEYLAARFQDRVAAAIEAHFEPALSDERLRRRLLSQVGTPRASEDTDTLLRVLKGRDRLAELAANLPLRIGNLTSGELDKSKALVDGVTAQDSELFPYALLTVMHRMAAPWQLVRLGTKAAGSDTAARVAETPFGVTVTIVVADLERMVGELRDELRTGRGIAVSALLKTIHDSARGLRTELDLPMGSTWGRALGVIRSKISDLLRAEIESMPGRVRQLLRPRPSSEIPANSMLDPEQVADVEALVEFVGSCRYFASELAISEMTQRTFADLQQFLDLGMQALLDGVRHAGQADRSFRQSQADAAVRLCDKVFGRDYAAMMGKAADVAGARDRKAG